MSEFNSDKFKKKLKKKIKKNIVNNKNYSVKSGGGFYFVGFVGAAIYFVSTADGFWVGVLGILKALVWPAFLVFEALQALGA